jgi:propanol-preferring alcohol dehydrogenase
MRAMVLRRIISLDESDSPLELADWPVPMPGPDEVLIRVSTCGVCHTELDEIEGQTPPPRLPIVLGHQVVGRIDRRGEGVASYRMGDRVGVGWIHSSSGGAQENLSSAFVATGRDVDGGYAEFMTARTNYVYPIPDCFNDVEAAPLLCAGSIGYRALKLTGLKDGQHLGLMGFGASAPCAPVSETALSEFADGSVCQRAVSAGVCHPARR